jgi:hypothetical protein
MDKFIDYKKEPTLHPELGPFPPFTKLTHTILYGPSGVGKYTHALRSIENYSSNKLKFEKRISVTPEFSIKISDIHYEVDMEMLGCNSKTLWNDTFHQILDIIQNKYTNKNGIILCKNMHKINHELLDIFYSYMQTPFVLFMLLSESVSFLPRNITSKCKIIPVRRPTKDLYAKCLQVPIPDTIHNIKQVLYQLPYSDPKKAVCTKLTQFILHPQFKFNDLREEIYSILIFDLGVESCIWSILSSLQLPSDKMNLIIYATIRFFQYYNNNYRPIYHLENYIYSIIKINDTN